MIAFFLLRILLPTVGTARYWLIIVPFILAFVGADQKMNQNKVKYNIMCFPYGENHKEINEYIKKDESNTNCTRPFRCA